jgi:hypothetical protein
MTFSCDVCFELQNIGSPMYGCRQCNYDVCEKCFTKEKELLKEEPKLKEAKADEVKVETIHKDSKSGAKQEESFMKMTTKQEKENITEIVAVNNAIKTSGVEDLASK